MNFDNTYPVSILVGWFIAFGTLTQSEDDPYEEIFGIPLTKIIFKLMDERKLLFLL
ncbi:unnamed protein product [Brassica rapa subsp. trilocularis]